MVDVLLIDGCHCVVLVLMENMAKEVAQIFTDAGVIHPLEVMNTVRERTIRKIEEENKNVSYRDYWTPLPPELIDRVRFYYRYEIALFGYPETPFVLKPPS